MGCTALDPNMTGRDQALFLNEHIPAGLFGGVGVEESRVAWRLSPQPFGLAASTLAAIERSRAMRATRQVTAICRWMVAI